jgi:ATP-dependent DNA ligase
MQCARNPVIRQSKAFLSPYVLLKTCAARNIEGIVSKRIDRPYVSGQTKDWIKVNCAAWREGWTYLLSMYSRKL